LPATLLLTNALLAVLIHREKEKKLFLESFEWGPEEQRRGRVDWGSLQLFFIRPSPSVTDEQLSGHGKSPNRLIIYKKKSFVATVVVIIVVVAPESVSTV
jgi:hypothetical protein